MNQEKIQLEALLAKVTQGEASDEEKEQVRRWLHELDLPDTSASRQELLEAKQNMLRAILPGAMEHRLPAAHTIPAARRIWPKLAVSAAVIVFLIAGGLWLQSHLNRLHQTQAVASARLIQTDSTVKYILLPDGSGVWMNAHSSLSYHPDSFAVKERKIQLEGEAYFEVKGNAAQPFVVTSGTIATRVLGTGFNVQTYRQDSTMKITLVHGSIAVDEPASGKTVLLTPKQQLQYSKTANAWKVLAFSQNPAKNWMSGGLVFREAPLSEVLDDIAHRYNVNINYSRSLVLDKQVTIDITSSHKMESALNSILYIHHLHYIRKGNQVYISRKQ